MSKSFETMGAYSEVSVNMSGEAEPLRLQSMQITEDVLHVLGVRPALGRNFTAYDYQLGTPDVALLSNGLAKTMYGDPAKALNRTIYLDHRPFIVVGVMPADFAFPSREAQLWQPLVFAAPFFQIPRGVLPVTVPGAPQEGPAVRGNVRFITPDYFNTLGIPLRSGRGVNDAAVTQTPHVAVISESLAKRLWPGQDPLGKQLNVLSVDRTVVGVVPLAYAAARGMSSALFSVEPTDVMTYASACLLVLVMTLIGSFVPAMRASRVDPAASIRGE